MKKIIILLALSLLAFQSGLKAQTNIQDAEYQKILKEYTLYLDGSFDYHYRKEIKLLTHFSFHRLFGETFIVYNPEYQKLKINEAYTIMADGKRVVTPENAFNEVLPGFARDVAAYNHLREMVVTHTGTEIGATIYLDYTIHNDRAFLPFFFGMEEIGENVPVKDLTINISVPEQLSLQYRMLNSRLAPEITELAGVRTYSWKFLNLPATPRSPGQDPEGKPVLHFTTGKDMTWAFFTFVNQAGFKDPAGAGISRRVDAVKNQYKDELQLILALQDVVLDEVKLVDIPMAYSGYRVRTPDQVWQSANATPLEKAVLLSKMLVLANINATPVASVTNSWYDQQLGNLAVFDGFLVQVNARKAGRIYLSVTKKNSQNLLYDLADKTLIQLDAAVESMRTFREKPATQLLQMEAELKVDKDRTISGKAGLRLEGFVNPYLKLYKDSSALKTMLAGDLKPDQLEKAEISSLSESRTKAELVYKASGPKPDFNGLLGIELPRYRSGFDSWDLVQYLGAGATSIRLEHPLWENYMFSLEVPDGYELMNPASIVINNSLGDLEISIRQEGNTIKIKRFWDLTRDVISDQDLDNFRKMIEAWENPNWRKVVVN